MVDFPANITLNILLCLGVMMNAQTKVMEINVPRLQTLRKRRSYKSSAHGRYVLIERGTDEWVRHIDMGLKNPSRI